MTTEAHYEGHLAPRYLWMAGGAEAALAAGAAELAELGLPAAGGDAVVDLGAGFGLHAIPLARSGARVTAIDFSARMLATLGELAPGLPIRVVRDDLLAFPKYLEEAPAAILCMGDTLTHLPSRAAVEQLVVAASAALRSGGVLVLSFRDYSVPLTGNARFIPVRSDASRIFTCFLEYEAEAVVVYDLVHEAASGGWHTRVSHYRKLRLVPDNVVALLSSNRFTVRREAGARGVVRLVARKG